MIWNACAESNKSSLSTKMIWDSHERAIKSWGIGPGEAIAAPNGKVPVFSKNVTIRYIDFAAGQVIEGEGETKIPHGVGIFIDGGECTWAYYDSNKEKTTLVGKSIEITGSLGGMEVKLENYDKEGKKDGEQKILTPWTTGSRMCTAGKCDSWELD